MRWHTLTNAVGLTGIVTPAGAPDQGWRWPCFPPDTKGNKRRLVADQDDKAQAMESAGKQVDHQAPRLRRGGGGRDGGTGAAKHFS